MLSDVSNTNLNYSYILYYILYYILFTFSESSEYSDWTEEVGLRSQQQAENRRPRRVCRVLSTSEEEVAEPIQSGPSSPQRQPKIKKESKKIKKPTKKKVSVTTSDLLLLSLKVKVKHQTEPGPVVMMTELPGSSP